MSTPSLPRVTVVIPNLEQGLYLERAICSVLDQGYDNLELFVMDGGSTDSSLDVIRTYEDDLTHWQSTWDSGPAEAVNTALAQATGKWFVVLDADDALLPYALQEAVSAMELTGSRWSVGCAVRVDESDEHLDDLPADPPRSVAAALLREGETTPGSVCTYQTELLRAVGGFESRFKLAYTHEMHTRLLAADQLPLALKVATAAVRDHDEALSITHSLTCGGEFLEVADRYAEAVPPTQRLLLWRTNEERRQIYAAAAAEAKTGERLRTRWQQLLRRAWWLRSSDYRRDLLQSLVTAKVASAPVPHRRAA